MTQSHSQSAARASWRISRSVLSQSSDLWNFHAAWCRFVDSKHDNLATRNHRHSIFELHCILRGSAAVMVESGERIELNAGDFCLIPPHLYHRFVFGSSDTMKLVAGFSVQPHNEAVRKSLQSMVACGRCHQSDAMMSLIQTLLLKAEQFYSVTASISVLVLQCIILECLEILKPGEMPPREDPVKHSINDERLDNARQYIQANISYPITGQEVAGSMGLSVRQLNRLCEASYGCSVHRWIQRLRIQHAQALLEVSPLSLKSIADSMNFSSVYAFIRVFKSVTGTTPGKYQRDASSR